MKFQKKAVLALLAHSAVVLTSAFVVPASRFGIHQTRCVAAPKFMLAPVVEESADEPASTEEPAIPDTEASTEEPSVSDTEASTEEQAIPDTEASTEESVIPDTEASVEEQATEAKEKAPRFTLYIRNLPYSTDEEELSNLFSAYGTVAQIAIPKKQGGQSRGFAFVDMGNQEELDAAIAAVDGLEVGGRTVFCTPSLPKDQLPPKQPRRGYGKDQARKVYVGNLPFGIAEEEIKDFFTPHGAVEEVFLAREGNGKDKGFGFVTFENEEGLEKAIEETNGQFFQGRRLAVRKPLPQGQKSEAAERMSDSARIYIGNLSFDTQLDTLQELFSEHGEVRSIFINENPETGESRGFGFARMPKEDAEKAIEALDGMEVDGRTIKVSVAGKKVDKTRVYIGNIDFATPSESIRSIVEEFGDIIDFYMPGANDFEGHRGFCIVSLGSDAAERTISELQGVEVDGRILQVNEAKPTVRKTGTKLYVGNLSFYTPLETLREVFEEYGEVIDCFMPLDGETGDSRGFGFVTMDPEGAERAIEELHDAEVDGRYIQVAEASPKP